MMSDGFQCARSRISHWDNNILSSIDALSRSRGYVWELKGLQLDKYKERVEWGAFWLLLILPSKLYRRSLRRVSIFNLHLDITCAQNVLHHQDSTSPSGRWHQWVTLNLSTLHPPEGLSSGMLLGDNLVAKSWCNNSMCYCGWFMSHPTLWVK